MLYYRWLGKRVVLTAHNVNARQRDGNDTWLNEGLATFMEMMYTLHSRGKLESLREFEANSQRYFALISFVLLVRL